MVSKVRVLSDLCYKFLYFNSHLRIHFESLTSMFL